MLCILARCGQKPHTYAFLLFLTITLSGNAHAAFTDIAVSFGIADGDSMSYGASFVDYDGDGDQDFYANNHWRSAAFYRNDAGSAVEASVHLDLELDDTDRHDNIWFDVDSDGDPDQYVIHGREQGNELFINEGFGSLVDRADEVGVLDMEGRGREIAVADFNNDGFVDIFIVNDFRAGFTRPSVLYLNNGDGTFFRHNNDDPIFRSRLHIAAADFDDDGIVDIVTTNPPFVAGEFYKGNGDTTWTNITDLAFQGIDKPLEQAQGIAWADYDNDGDLDLCAIGGNRGVWDHVAQLAPDSMGFYFECETAEIKELQFETDAQNIVIDAIRSEYQPLECFYGGSGTSTTSYPATFTRAELLGEPPALSGGSRAMFAWITTGLVDTVHVVVGGPSGMLLQVGGTVQADVSGILSFTTIGQEPPPPLADDNWRNRLFRNNGDQTFTEVTATAFATNDTTFNSKGMAWADYDCDGWIDLFVANGGTVETGNQANYLYRNNGDGSFTEVAAVEGVTGSSIGMSDGACWGDINNDGFMDLFVDNGAEHPPFGVGPRQLFQNTPNSNHWLKLKLRGLVSNGSGIGAKIRVVTAAGSQWRFHLGETDNSFANTDVEHFGLGAASVVDSVVITWPSGQIDVHQFVPGDISYWAIEGKPLRIEQNAHFSANRNDIFDNLEIGETKDYPIPLENFGGLASHYSASYVDCQGAPVTWASVTPATGVVFPGGTNPITLTVDTSTLLPGLHCARIIFTSNSFLGPDTLNAFIDVTDPATGVDLGQGLPTAFELSRPRPNPSRTGFSFELALPAPGPARVDVFDIHGRRVRSILVRDLSAGRHAIEWDGLDASRKRVASGTYMIQAISNENRSVRKAIVLE